MSLDIAAQKYIEQTWGNLPIVLGIISAGENVDRLAKVLFENMSDDQVAELRDRLSALLEGE